MKRSFAVAVRFVVATSIAGCALAGPPNAQEVGRPAARSPALSSLTAERLNDLSLSSAYDALSYIPDYGSRLNRRPPPRVVLFLDGARFSDLEVLKTLRAGDVREIRVIGENRTLSNGGDVELVVTTVGGSRVAR